MPFQSVNEAYKLMKNGIMENTMNPITGMIMNAIAAFCSSFYFPPIGYFVFIRITFHDNGFIIVEMMSFSKTTSVLILSVTNS